jgi:F-type H+-transporting ATPase subunit a
MFPDPKTARRCLLQPTYAWHNDHLKAGGAMGEFETSVIIPIPKIAGIDLSITNDVVLVWMAGLLTLLVLLPVCRRRAPIAHGFYQNLMEGLIEFVEREVVVEGLGSAGRIWAPFLLTMFFFILCANLLGLVPVPSVFHAVTANINVTAALALIVFILTIGLKIRRQGVLGLLRGFMPQGVPWWMAFLVVPIEVLSWLARPLSLAVRLFANMMAGHALIFVFIGMAMGSAWLLKALPLVGAIVMDVFELFVAFVQAFIFTMLAGIYIKDAIEEEAH